MPAYSVTEEYFSGQGVVLVASRDATTGLPTGMRSVGNVPALSIKNATTVIEHKESTTGQRGTDKRLTTEVKVNLELTMENFNSKNLALVTRGGASVVAASSVVAEAVNGYIGAVSPLAHIKVSSLVVKQGATTLTAYTNATTTWDYKSNTETGSIILNDGLNAAATFSNAGIAASAVTVGATTTLTVVNNAVAGGKVHLRGFAGADAADLNNKIANVVSATSTQIVVDINTTAKVITVGTNKVVWDGTSLLIDYAWAAQTQVDSFTAGQPELYLRFEGLNTAEDNSPVVIEVFKFAVDPTQDLSLISDTMQSFVLQGSVLKDDKRATGSPYYKVTKIDEA